MSKKALTSTQIEKAKPHPTKPTYLSDQDGLYLEVAPAGSKKVGKWWRFRYRLAGKAKLMSLGTYPEVSLAEARTKRDAARVLVAKGQDPAEEKKAVKVASLRSAENTFEVVAMRWFESKQKVNFWDAEHAERILSRMQRDLFPALGARPIDQITAPEVLAVLRQIEARGVYATSRRAKSECERIFALAIAEGLIALNPAAGLNDALVPVPEVVHRPAITKPGEFAHLLRLIDAYVGTDIVVRSGLRLNPLIPVRPGELRTAKWIDIDFDDAVWYFDLSKTRKSGVKYLIVPLSRQALAILEELRQATRGEWVFPNPRSTSRPMSENGVLFALRSMGISKEQACGHGFRTSFRTMAAEQLNEDEKLLEHQIGHLIKWPEGRAYSRTEFLDLRRGIMQRWADYCDRLKSGPATVVMKPRVA